MKWKRITISRSNFEPNLPFLAAFNLDSATNEADLNRFIDEQLQQNRSFNLEMNETVEAVCSFFREIMSPREILKVLYDITTPSKLWKRNR